jgi:hypothetical protein
VSSSVKAMIGARAGRQPRLRAAAGPLLKALSSATDDLVVGEASAVPNGSK